MDGTAAILLFALGLYLLPTVVAFSRDVPDKGTIAVVNTFGVDVHGLGRVAGARLRLPLTSGGRSYSHRGTSCPRATMTKSERIDVALLLHSPRRSGGTRC